jgi:hypothetical protein
MSGETSCDSMTYGNNAQSIPGRCGARTKSGGLCAAWPVAGSARCRMHSGVDSAGRPPVHGRYSRVARGKLKGHLEQWEQDEGDWRSCKAEIAVQQALLEIFVSKLPEDGRITARDHALAQSWTEAISRTKLRAAKIEQSSAITIREIRLLEAVFAKELVNLVGEERAAAFLDHVADLLSTEGLALPAPADVIEGTFTGNT